MLLMLLKPILFFVIGHTLQLDLHVDTCLQRVEILLRSLILILVMLLVF